MSGGAALGHWEVKDCTSFKALSVCKQTVSDYEDLHLPLPDIDPFAPCPDGWETSSHLLHCYKVPASFILLLSSCLFSKSISLSLSLMSSHLTFLFSQFLSVVIFLIPSEAFSLSFSSSLTCHLAEVMDFPGTPV